MRVDRPASRQSRPCQSGSVRLFGFTGIAVRLPPESPFGFRRNHRSGSAGIAVRLPPESPFGMLRNTHQRQARRVSRMSDNKVATHGQDARKLGHTPTSRSGTISLPATTASADAVAICATVTLIAILAGGF